MWGAGETDERKPQKVCGKCFDVLLPMQPYLAATTAKAVQAPDFSPPTTLEWLGKPVSRSFRLEIKKGVHNLHSFLGMPDADMVKRQMAAAHGIGLLSIAKAGFLGAVQGGGGLLIGRDQDTGEWSAPCSIGCAGLSGGFLVPRRPARSSLGQHTCTAAPRPPPPQPAVHPTHTSPLAPPALHSSMPRRRASS